MPDKMQIKTYYANDDLLTCPTDGNKAVSEETVAEWIATMGGWTEAVDFLFNLYFPHWYEHKRKTEQMRRAKAMRENKNGKGGQVGRTWKRKEKS